ncbi:DUF3189 family protein [Tepidibacter aestuarii]|uniref:DUF3189 family protein n=1 Tax=Tepidibacter aestuarii TaxID=2925782 RepID=UPI0020C05E43|nr:DUF3189 family protein [Tepidibacter aestuarii]CAH2214862.1 conserved protein of unknown function [Tepidibacter aestuarii]
MKIIYHCVGGTHSSAIASTIHLNILPSDRVPNADEIMNIGCFDTLQKKDMGTLFLRGIDEFGNEVYTLGRQFNKNLVLNTVKSTYSINNKNSNDLLLIDTMPTVNIPMKIGGFSSRRLHLVSFGRPIVLKGSQKAYKDIIKLVKDTKEQFRS